MAEGALRRATFHVLGSGCFAPGPGERGARVRNPSGYALEAGGCVLLFDFGFGNLRQLYRAGLESRRVCHAFFSHKHPDHVADLAALLFHFRYDAKPDSGKLRVYGPKGFARFVEKLSEAYEPWLGAKGYALSVTELASGDGVEGPGWTVVGRTVPHPPPSLAYRFDSEAGSLCYTGDTGFDPGLAEFASGVDLFVLECTLPDGSDASASLRSDREDLHLTVSQAFELAGAAKARRALLSHLSSESARQARSRLPAKGVSLARDLMRVPLR